MLVLGRKEGEKIQIGPDIVVSVERIDWEQVQIGIEAPKSINILRSEVARRDQQDETRKQEPG